MLQIPSEIIASNTRRRFFLHKLTSLSALIMGYGLAGNGSSRAEEHQVLLTQAPEATPEQFMQRALAMRDLALSNGDQGYGAIIVKNNRIVGQSPSRVIVNQDPSAHAEMEVIRATARILGTRDLSGCMMYSSSPPCPMCRAAAYWAGIERLFYGANITDGGSPYLC